MVSFFSDEFMRSALSHPLFRPRIISEEDYEITPKPHLIKKQIQELQEKINLNKRLRDMTVKRYDDEINELEAKISELQEGTKKKGITK